jgi:hypothetical protein
MSNYRGKAINPSTGEVEEAWFMDDHYGKHEYAVEFDDGDIYPISEVEVVEEIVT